MMNDLISRQAAIEAVRKAKDKSEAHRMLLQLPPAQLAQDLPKGCTDTISRQAAITEFSRCELTPDGGIDANYAIDFLKQMSPVDAVPVVRGEWIVGNHLFRRCDRCGWERMDDNPNWDTNFCPNCGAIMDGKDGEQI